MYKQFFFTIAAGWIRPNMLAEPVLLSAASFARGRKTLPDVALPPQISEVAVDSGAYAATFKYGCYPFTPEAYVEWLGRIHPTPSWAAMMDRCCSATAVREPQEWTTKMAWYFWQSFRARPWAWVPTIQGYQTSEYRWHARQMRPLIEEMLAYYGPSSAFRVGVGSLLAGGASAQMIQEVVSAIAGELPGVPFHLWGIKYRVLKHRIPLHQMVISSDSAAWNGRFGRDIERWRQSGKKEREWAWEDAAPQYNRKIKAALEQPKQRSLFD